MAFDELTTEARAERPDYDRSSTAELVELINREDATVPGAVARVATELAAAIDAIVERLRRGGSPACVGGGSSRAIARFDAARCEGTTSNLPGSTHAACPPSALTHGA